MSYEENIRAILQCCFSQSKDELIEVAVSAILALKPNPVFIPQPQTPLRPLDPWYVNTDPVPKYETEITC